MIANESMPNMLNEQQIMMLRLLQKPLPEQDFKQMQRLAVTLLAKQLDENIDAWEQDNNITPNDHEVMLNSHFRTSNSQ